MTLLQKAAKFVTARASRLAVAIVPLAAAAVSTIPAKADAFLLTPNSGCLGSVTPNSGSATCSVVQLSGIGGNASGNLLGLYGSGNLSNGNSGGSIDFNDTGSATGSISAGAVIPVSWLFSVSNNTLLLPQLGSNFSISDSVAWNLSFSVTVSGGATQAYTATANGIASLGSNVSGTGLITIPVSGSVVGWSMFLDTSSGTDYTVSIPSNGTLNLNATPEPATLFLLPSAGAVLLLKRRKRKPAAA